MEGRREGELLTCIKLHNLHHDESAMVGRKWLCGKWLGAATGAEYAAEEFA